MSKLISNERIVFVEIRKDNDKEYASVYVTVMKKGFLSSTKFMKLTFIADNPYAWMSEIISELKSRGIFIEDLEDGLERDIGIGKITLTEFTRRDEELYNKESATVWDELFEKALTDQETLTKNYKDEKASN